MSPQALFAITEGKSSQPSERKSHLRRTHLSARQDGPPGCKNYVWLWCGAGTRGYGRHECSGEKAGAAVGVCAMPVGVIEISDQTDPFHSDYRPQDARCMQFS